MAKMLSGLVHVRPGDDASTRGEHREKLTIAAAMLLHSPVDPGIRTGVAVGGKIGSWAESSATVRERP
jgi:hypothetical protein